MANDLCEKCGRRPHAWFTDAGYLCNECEVAFRRRREDEEHAARIEKFRAALMEAHADDWSMETIAEAAHICANAERLKAVAGPGHGWECPGLGLRTEPSEDRSVMPVSADQPEPTSADYQQGVRDGMVRAALMVRRYECAIDLSLLACVIEDTAGATNDPATCSHPYWLAPTPDGPVCRSCGADVSHLDPMGG